MEKLDGKLAEIRDYWNDYITDIRLAKSPVGTKEFFDELDTYRFGRSGYLLPIVEARNLKGKRLLDIGCGVALELVQFAKAGAIVTGIDLCARPIELAKKNFAHNGVDGNLLVMNGEGLQFEDNSFDYVYSRMPLQYTESPDKMVAELYRVLRKGGVATLIVFNRYSWLNLAAKLSGENLLHQRAPVFNLYSAKEFGKLLSCFKELAITTERLPTKTTGYPGFFVSMYNHLFVPAVKLVPETMLKSIGAHIVARAVK
ncbi:MAG TPA: class I SAM-dependent methyltransferase [Thermodesulfobacteriota bacterium]